MIIVISQAKHKILENKKNEINYLILVRGELLYMVLWYFFKGSLNIKYTGVSKECEDTFGQSTKENTCFKMPTITFES